MDIPDFANLPIQSVLALALAIAALDVVTSVIAALIRGTFDSHLLLEYVRTHVLLRAFPILALAVIGHGAESIGIPAIPAAGLAATASLGLYVIETLGSLNDLRSGSPAPDA